MKADLGKIENIAEAYKNNIDKSFNGWYSLNNKEFKEKVDDSIASTNPDFEKLLKYINVWSVDDSGFDSANKFFDKCGLDNRLVNIHKNILADSYDKVNLFDKKLDIKRPKIIKISSGELDKMSKFSDGYYTDSLLFPYKHSTLIAGNAPTFKEAMYYVFNKTDELNENLIVGKFDNNLTNFSKMLFLYARNCSDDDEVIFKLLGYSDDIINKYLEIDMNRYSMKRLISLVLANNILKYVFYKKHGLDVNKALLIGEGNLNKLLLKGAHYASYAHASKIADGFTRLFQFYNSIGVTENNARLQFSYRKAYYVSKQFFSVVSVITDEYYLAKYVEDIIINNGMFGITDFFLGDSINDWNLASIGKSVISDRDLIFDSPGKSYYNSNCKEYKRYDAVEINKHMKIDDDYNIIDIDDLYI